MTQEELVLLWDSNTPHQNIILINDVIESGQNLSDKFKSLDFIDLKFDQLPSGFKNWLLQFFCVEN